LPAEFALLIGDMTAIFLAHLTLRAADRTVQTWLRGKTKCLYNILDGCITLRQSGRTRPTSSEALDKLILAQRDIFGKPYKPKRSAHWRPSFLAPVVSGAFRPRYRSSGDTWVARIREGGKRVAAGPPYRGCGLSVRPQPASRFLAQRQSADPRRIFPKARRRGRLRRG
jgi:hypothetical protein